MFTFLLILLFALGALAILFLTSGNSNFSLEYTSETSCNDEN